MRLTSLEIEGFRAFAEPVAFDLDANAVILVAANGQGKTSFFDAVMWGLAGAVPRIGDTPDLIVSRYGSGGQARVRIGLVDSGDRLHVTRTFDGVRSRLLLEINGEEVPEAVAEARFAERLWPQADSGMDGISGRIRALERGVYLQQDRLRDFLEADTDAERFSAISELVGVGRITELHAALDRSKRAWSQEVNELGRQVEQLGSEERRLLKFIERLGDADDHTAGLDRTWSEWWARAQGLGLAEPTPRIDSPSAHDALDSAVRFLHAIHRRELRRLGVVEEALNFWRKEPSEAAGSPTLQSLHQDSGQLILQIEEVGRDLEAARRTAAERRAGLVKEAERDRELSSLATLALRHLGMHCPVCEQSIDEEAVAQHLRELLATSTGEEESAMEDGAISILVERRQDLEAQKAGLDRLIEERSRADRTRQSHLQEIREELHDLGTEGPSDSISASQLSFIVSEIDKRVAELDSVRASGEALALDLARRSESATHRRVMAELEGIRSKLHHEAAELRSRERTGAMGARVLESLRDAEWRAVDRQILRLTPLLRRIYGRMDPHPFFRDVALVTRSHYGKGRIDASVGDPTGSVVGQDPTIVLSSSQVNVLALAIFLSFNLGLQALPLDTALLDDPVQSLDDINVLGLTDLLRRAKDQRQIVVSTHDPQLGSLLARKLRPTRPSDRTILINLSGWRREGPRVETIEIPLSAAMLRVVA